MHTRFVSGANGTAGSSRRSRCITSSLWQRAVITAKQILCPYVLLVMRKFMQNVGIAGTITKGPKGGQNHYGRAAGERARGLACEKGEIKRVIMGGRLRLLIFSRKGVRKCRQNPITQAGAAVRDPVREGRNPLSGRKPRTAIRADAD